MFDLSGNKVGKGVKTGGYMISGTYHVDVYVSYKTSDGESLALAWIQEEVGSKPYLVLHLRRVGTDSEVEPQREIFSDPDEAVGQYLQGLGRLLGSSKSAA